MSCRIDRNVTRPDTVNLTVDGTLVEAFEGESLATVLLVEGKQGNGWSLFCNMGSCYACMVDVASGPDQPPMPAPACLTPVSAGMVVRTGTGS